MGREIGKNGNVGRGLQELPLAPREILMDTWWGWSNLFQKLGGSFVGTLNEKLCYNTDVQKTLVLPSKLP